MTDTFAFANFAQTTLGADIEAADTTATLALGTGSLMPILGAGQMFAAVITDAATKTYNEVVYVTAISGDTITMVRGQEGTAARAWLSGDFFANKVTAGTLRSFGLLIGANFDVPGSVTVPTSAGNLIIQWGYAILQNGSEVQTVIDQTLETPWPNGFILGFCEDSDLEPSFQYSCSVGGQVGGSALTSVTLRCANHYIDDGSGSIVTRSVLSGYCRGVWLALGY